MSVEKIKVEKLSQLKVVGDKLAELYRQGGSETPKADALNFLETALRKWRKEGWKSYPRYVGGQVITLRMTMF